MSRRHCDPLGDTRRPHWLTVSDLHRNVIESQAVAPGADLRAVLRDALAAQALEGWKPENDGGYGFVFVARGTERRLVNLTPADPSSHCTGLGHSFLAGKGATNQSVA